MCSVKNSLNYCFITLIVVVLTSCGEDSGPGGTSEEGGSLYGLQSFKDDFESGNFDSRWGCDFGGCNWEVVETPGALLSGTTSSTNYALQSPDAQLESSLFGSCERFRSYFEQAGTFAFDYYIDTYGPVGFQDGNLLEVSIGTNMVEFDPDFNDFFPIDTKWEKVLSIYGNSNSRFQKTLEAGYYDFEFCYSRNRTFNVTEPDFVQIDNVETCVGNSCFIDIATIGAAPCIADQGETLVPDLSSVPLYLFTITGSGTDGYSPPYVFIINADFLDILIADLDDSDPNLAFLRHQINGVRDELLVDAESCDTDSRKYVRLQLTEQELIEFTLMNYEINVAYVWVYMAIKQGWTIERTQEMVQAFLDAVTPAKAKKVQRYVDVID